MTESHCVSMLYLLVHSPTNGHTGCFQIMVVMNDAEMNMGMQMLFDVLTSVPVDAYQEVG